MGGEGLWHDRILYFFISNILGNLVLECVSPRGVRHRPRSGNSGIIGRFLGYGMARIFKLGTTTCSLQTTASTAALHPAGPCHDLAECFGWSSSACCDGVEFFPRREMNLFGKTSLVAVRSLNSFWAGLFKIHNVLYEQF